MADSNDKRYGYLEHLSTEKLEKLLQLAIDPQADDEDNEYIDAILEVILSREKENPTGRLSDTKQAWHDFQIHYNTPEGKNETLYYKDEPQAKQPSAAPSVASHPAVRHLKVRRLLIAAVITILVVSLTCIPVLGYANILQMFAEWTADQFQLKMSGYSLSEPEHSPNSDVQTDDLETIFAEYNIDSAFYPTWIPEEFKLSNQVISENPRTDGIDIAMLYICDSDQIIAEVFTNMAESGSTFEKDSNQVEVYLSGGIEHYLFSNNENHVAVWYTDPAEYSISTSLPLADLKI